MNVLITGATGFIGSHLVDRLQKDGHRISALVRRTSRTDKLKENSVDLVLGDICEASTLDRIFGRFDVLFHCAAFVSGRDIKRLYKTNVEGTENVFRLAERLKVSKIVYLSSVAVVSGNPDVPLKEGLPYMATNPYGRTKIEAEKIALNYRNRGTKIAIIRPCMVYGEAEPHLQNLLLRLIKLGLFPILNDGKNRMHLAYVGNVVNALAEASLDARFLEGSFFVADKEILTVKEIFDIFSESIEARRPIFLPDMITQFIKQTPFLRKKADFFFKDRVYDISRLVSTGFRFEYDARDALFKTARFWLSNSGYR